MKSLFEELAMAALVCICVIVVLSSFSDIFSNDLMRDTGIDFESGAEVYTTAGDNNYQQGAATFEDNVSFTVQPVKIPYNNGGNEFNWKDYIKEDEIIGDNTEPNTCYAILNKGKGDTETKYSLTDFVVPYAYLGADVSDLPAIDKKIVNVRKAGTQMVPLLLKWEGISIRKDMYVTVEENPTKYTIYGKINGYGSDYGVRSDQTIILQADGEEYAYSITENDGSFVFDGLNEENFTIKANVVTMDEYGNFSEKTYAYNISKEFFDEALDNDSSNIDLGTIALNNVNDVYINSINYLIPIGMTWEEFIDLHYNHLSGEFVRYEYKSPDGSASQWIASIYFDEPSAMMEVTYDYGSNNFELISDEIEEGTYEILVAKKDNIYGGTKEVNYFGIVKN